MGHAVRLADLYALPPREREAELRRLADMASEPAADHHDSLRAQVADFERRYEMTSAELLQHLERDEMPETDDVAEWLFLLQFLERLSAGEKAPA